MIERLAGFPDNVFACVCSGRVTKADYEKVLAPAVQTALKTRNRLRLYYETAPDFSGPEPGAMWEDFEIGVEHSTRWERIAVVTDVDWIRHTVWLFSFLMPGRTKVFPASEAAEARSWIASAR